VPEGFTPPSSWDGEDGAVLDGAAFVLDMPAVGQSRWGRGGDVLWQVGESLMLCGPTGVGKTTVAGQLIAGLLGIRPDVLGYPVLPARKVLYLAMDRPRQISRALRRLFGPEHRQVLAERLVVRQGPLPQDLVRHPTLLIELAQKYGVDVVIVDSLKDAAVKLSDDESGGNINRAIQFCNVAEVDVLVLHHQRKSENGGTRPTKLDDVYGSALITAGTGSVVLLWGEAGAELVELVHLKPVTDPVGPLQVEHDHQAGTSTVVKGWDPLAYLRIRGAQGATVAEAAQAHHGAPQTPDNSKSQQTRRKLQGLVRDGLATRQEPSGLVGVEVRFYAVGSAVASPLTAPLTRLFQEPVDIPVDIPVDNR
jgi:replicative DNA helicase